MDSDTVTNLQPLTKTDEKIHTQPKADTITKKAKNPNRVAAGKKLVEWNRKNKELLKQKQITTELNSDQNPHIENVQVKHFEQKEDNWLKKWQPYIVSGSLLGSGLIIYTVWNCCKQSDQVKFDQQPIKKDNPKEDNPKVLNSNHLNNTPKNDPFHMN